ncbi:M23 family metallopeptidase [Thermaurantiacus sp.]
MATLADTLPLARAAAGGRRSLGLPRTALPPSADVELAIDLGDSIGSLRWWQGLVTLGLLVIAVLALGARAPAIPVAAPTPAAGTAAGSRAASERAADRIGALVAGSPTGRSTPATSAVIRLAEIPERPRLELSTRTSAGGLSPALRRAGVGRDDLDATLELVRSAIDPEGLKQGTEVALVLGRRETRAVPRPLELLAFRAAFDLKLEVVREGGELRLVRIPIRVDETPLRIQGKVGRSLSQTLRGSGIPAGVAADFMRQIGHVLDTQRDLRGKDRFDLVVEHRRAETGEREFGRLLYAGLDDGKRRIALLRFGAKGEFFRDNGESARRGLIRTPVEGARMSSGFGMRFHPILGFSRMHQGLDFAAATGTPVVASAGGKVIQAGWGGGYGNVVKIEHSNGLVTRYAHLSRIDVKNGQAVSQGQRIGAVGSTGLSTGPHLHYEVWLNGKAVNPAQARYLSGNQLTGAELQRFKAELEAVRRLAVTPAS